MRWPRLAPIGLIALFGSGTTACIHTYNPEELRENAREQERSAESEVEYDEQVEETGGTNADLLRDGEESVVTDSER